MTPKEWFDVMVRTVGVVAMLFGMWDLVNAALFYTEYFRNPDMTERFYLLFGWANIFIGLSLIRFSHVLVNFAYSEENTEGDSNDESDEEKM